MNRNLIKAGTMMLTLMIALTFVTGVCGQDTSNGTAPLQNKTVVGNVDPNCKVVDSMHTFWNARAQEWPSFPDFTNGDRRVVQEQDRFFNGAPTDNALYGKTSCACGTNSFYFRNFYNDEDSLTWFITWDGGWFPRNADCTLGVLRKPIPFKACLRHKPVAEEEEEPPVDPGSCPIVLDLNGDGLVRLTDVANGVLFDLNSNGEKERLPWLTDAEDGFLVFDAYQNGVIENGRHFFGNHSFGGPANGYLGLAAFDDNKDRLISALDGIWPSLAVWNDKNRDGVSQAVELKYLSTFLKFISLTYKESRRKDKHGNEFRYRSDIEFLDGHKGFSFDVIFTTK